MPSIYEVSSYTLSTTEQQPATDLLMDHLILVAQDMQSQKYSLPTQQQTICTSRKKKKKNFSKPGRQMYLPAPMKTALRHSWFCTQISESRKSLRKYASVETGKGRQRRKTREHVGESRCRRRLRAVCGNNAICEPASSLSVHTSLSRIRVSDGCHLLIKTNKPNSSVSKS